MLGSLSHLLCFFSASMPWHRWWQEAKPVKSTASQPHSEHIPTRLMKAIISHKKLGLQDIQVSQGMLLPRPTCSIGLKFQTQTKPQECHMMPNGTYASTARQPRAEQQHCNFRTHQPGNSMNYHPTVIHRNQINLSPVMHSPFSLPWYFSADPTLN